MLCPNCFHFVEVVETGCFCWKNLSPYHHEEKKASAVKYIFMILVHSLFLNIVLGKYYRKYCPCSVNLVSCSDRHVIILTEPSSEISQRLFKCSKIWLDIKFLQLGGFSVDSTPYSNFQNKFIHSHHGYLLSYQHCLIPGNTFLVISPTHLQSTVIS